MFFYKKIFPDITICNITSHLLPKSKLKKVKMKTKNKINEK